MHPGPARMAPGSPARVRRAVSARVCDAGIGKGVPKDVGFGKGLCHDVGVGKGVSKGVGFNKGLCDAKGFRERSELSEVLGGPRSYEVLRGPRRS